MTMKRSYVQLVSSNSHEYHIVNYAFFLLYGDVQIGLEVLGNIIVNVGYCHHETESDLYFCRDMVTSSHAGIISWKP